MTDSADVDEAAAPCRGERCDAPVRASGSLVLAATMLGNGRRSRGVGSHPFSSRVACEG